MCLGGFCFLPGYEDNICSHSLKERTWEAGLSGANDHTLW